MAKKTENTPEVPGDASKNLLGTLLRSDDLKTTHFNFVNAEQTIIPSGSLILDNFLKVRSGSVIRMGGPAEVGKTSQSLLFAKNYMETMAKSKTIYCNVEAKFSPDLQKRTGMKFTKDAANWEFGSCFIFDCNCFDTICEVLYSLYKSMAESGEHLCVILDSVDMLTLKSSLEKGITEGKKPAGVNYLTKELFRRLAHLNTSYDGLMIMITQFAATFSMDSYSQADPSLMKGNNTHALNHQAAVALYYRPRAASHYILEKEKEKPDPVENKILGIECKIDVRKSTTDQSGYTLTVPIKKDRPGGSIWTEKEIFDTMFLLGLLDKKGAWITISSIVEGWGKEAGVEILMKHQGLNQFSAYFESNPAAMKCILDKIKTLYS